MNRLQNYNNRISKEETENFIGKIFEIIDEFQNTLDNPLSENDINAVKSLIVEQIMYIINCNDSTFLSLEEIIKMGIGYSNRNVTKIKEEKSHIKRCKKIVESSQFLTSINDGSLSAEIGNLELRYNIPYFCCFIEPYFLAISNYRPRGCTTSQFLFSTNPSIPVDTKYNLFSYTDIQGKYKKVLHLTQ